MTDTESKPSPIEELERAYHEGRIGEYEIRPSGEIAHRAEPKTSPTMEDFEQILGYLDGDYESRCEGVQRLRDAFQTLLSENAELRAQAVLSESKRGEDARDHIGDIALMKAEIDRLRRRPTREQVQTVLRKYTRRVYSADGFGTKLAREDLKELLSQLYPAESEGG